LVRGVQALRDRAKALTAFAAKALVDRPPLQPLLKQPAVEVPLSVISDRVDFTINEIVKKIAGGGSFASVFEDIDDESRTVQVGHFDVLFKTRDEYVKLGFISIILADVNLFVDAVRILNKYLSYYFVILKTDDLLVLFMTKGYGVIQHSSPKGHRPDCLASAAQDLHLACGLPRRLSPSPPCVWCCR
jgi:hypothetical protein